MNITLFGRFYERFADHAAEIGRRIVFQVTGQHPGLLAIERGASVSTVTVLDDYQSVALTSTDWSAVQPDLHRRRHR